MVQQDDATRAVVTALEMQATLQSLNLKRAPCGGVPIALGTGINAGEAISGNLGPPKRMEFTVIGGTTSLAACLESRATQAQILIGDFRKDAGPGRLRVSRAHEHEGQDRAGGYLADQGTEDPELAWGALTPSMRVSLLHNFSPSLRLTCAPYVVFARYVLPHGS